MKEDVGMSKPKKHVNKVGRLATDLKLNECTKVQNPR